MPEKSRVILAELNKGNKYSLGKKMTKDNFEKLMAVHIGAKRTDEARKNMSEAHKGKPWTDKQRFGRHNRYHFNAPKPDTCKFCIKESDSLKPVEVQRTEHG